MEKLNEILNSQPVKDRDRKFKEYLGPLLEGEVIVEKINEYLNFAGLDQLGLNTSRQLYQDFIDLFGSYASISEDGIVIDGENESVNTMNDELRLIVWRSTLEKLMSRSVAFEEQISIVSQFLALLLQKKQEWSQAANILKQIPIDSGTRIVSISLKFKIYIWIVRLYLEDEDFVSADSYLNRASMISDGLNKFDLIQVQACQAQSLDLKRQFLPSALKYFELSNTNDLSNMEIIEALKNSVICTILAGAGPQRSKLLAKLYQDPRSKQAEHEGSVVFKMLTNMHLMRVCRTAEVKEFEKILRPHQLATLPDGLTVFDRSIIEHNILALSKLYTNITFPGLAAMLSIDNEKAEQMACKMIVEDRLDAKIVQGEKLLIFKNSVDREDWQKLISTVCEQVEDCVTQIKIK